MSCVLLRSETLSALAEYAASLLNMGYEYFGMNAPESLFEALKDCSDGYRFFSEEKIYAKICELNRAAYTGRYEGEPEALSRLPAKMPPYHANRQYDRGKYLGGDQGHWEVSAWHYQMFSRLDCFLYQCSENPAHKTPLFQAMSELRDAFALFIVRNSAEYAAHPWGK